MRSTRELETMYLADGVVSQRLPKRLITLRRIVHVHQTDEDFLRAAAELEAGEKFLVDKIRAKVPLEDGAYSVAVASKPSLTGISWKTVACTLLEKIVRLRARLLETEEAAKVNKVFAKLDIPIEGSTAVEAKLKAARTVSKTEHTARIFRNSVEIKFD